MEDKSATYCKCLYYSANALARVMTKIAEEEFAPSGLAPSYAFLLMTVNGKPGIQPTEISEIMMLNPSTVTRLMEKMADKGYISRKASGKSVFIHPTEKGRKLEAKIRECWKNVYKRYVAELGESHANLLTGAIYEAAKKLGG